VCVCARVVLCTLVVMRRKTAFIANTLLVAYYLFSVRSLFITHLTAHIFIPRTRVDIRIPHTHTCTRTYTHARTHIDSFIEFVKQSFMISTPRGDPVLTPG